MELQELGDYVINTLYQNEIRTVTSPEESSQQMTLNNTPIAPAKVVAHRGNYGGATSGVHFSVSGSLVTWHDPPGPTIVAGETITFIYFCAH